TAEVLLWVNSPAPRGRCTITIACSSWRSGAGRNRANSRLERKRSEAPTDDIIIRLTIPTSRGLVPKERNRGLKRTLAFAKQQMAREFQAEWRWCCKCQGLFFSGNPSQGICPSGDKFHDASKSGKYLVNFGETQPGGGDGFNSTPGQQG